MSTLPRSETTADARGRFTNPQGVDRGLRDDVFEVLSSVRRRLVVHYLLQDPDREVSLRELSRQIAAWENDVDPAAVTTNQRKRVYTALRQSHLPALAERGFVEYDDDRSLVRATDRVSDLRIYLEIVPGNEIPWSTYYVGLGVLCGSLVLAKSIGLFPFSEVPALGWAAAIALLILASGLAHVYRNRQTRLGRDGRPPSMAYDE